LIYNFMSNIYFRLNGGLGNQLSQFSAALFYSKKFNIEVKYDDYYISKSSKKHEVISLPNLFGQIVTFSCFKSKFSRLINRILYKLGLNTIPILGFHFFFEDLKCINLNTTVIVEGFWQNNMIYTDEAIKIINNCILEKIDITNSKFNILKKINQNNIAMHVRRGDYLTNKHFLIRQQYVLPAEYYNNSIKEVRNKYTGKITIFLFSDDIISLDFFDDKNIDIVVVNNNVFNDIEAFYLYSRFCVCIIANSTFSMWGALIAKHLFGSAVYAPYIWHKNKPWDLDIIPKQFIVLKF